MEILTNNPKKKTKINKKVLFISSIIFVLTLSVIITSILLIHNRSGTNAKDKTIENENGDESNFISIIRENNSSINSQDDLDKTNKDNLDKMFPYANNRNEIDDIVKNEIYNCTQKWYNFVQNGLVTDPDTSNDTRKSNKSRMNIFIDENSVKTGNHTVDEVKAYIRFLIYNQDEEKKYQLVYSPASLKARMFDSILLHWTDNCNFYVFNDEDAKINDIYYSFLDDYIEMDKVLCNCKIYFSSKNKSYVAYSYLSGSGNSLTCEIYDIDNV